MFFHFRSSFLPSSSVEKGSGEEGLTPGWGRPHPAPPSSMDQFEENPPQEISSSSSCPRRLWDEGQHYISASPRKLGWCLLVFKQGSSTYRLCLCIYLRQKTSLFILLFLVPSSLPQSRHGLSPQTCVQGVNATAGTAEGAVQEPQNLDSVLFLNNKH